MRIVYLFLLVLTSSSIKAQELDSLTFYADVMRHADVPLHREWAADHFYRQLTLEIENKDFKPRPELTKWVSVLPSPSESFTLYTWHLDGRNGVSYHGIIKLKNGDIIPLDHTPIDYVEATYDEFGPQEWPGALYYELIEVKDETYILLGLNASGSDHHVKVAESMKIDEGKVVFGVPVFYMDQDDVRPDVKHRYVLQYSSKSAARLTFDRNENLIFFDNLIPLETMEDKDQVSWVPDGSYSGFKKTNERWQFQEKLFTQTVEEPPGLQPTTDEPEIKRDILGRPRK